MQMIYELVDQGLLSTSWDDASISDVGFGTPLQFKEFKESIDVGLPMARQLQLLEPKPFAENLEWLVAECLQKRTIPVPIFICFSDKLPTNIPENHNIVSWESFSIATHVNLMMKPFPDNYGTGRYIDLLA